MVKAQVYNYTILHQLAVKRLPSLDFKSVVSQILHFVPIWHQNSVAQRLWGRLLDYSVYGGAFLLALLQVGNGTHVYAWFCVRQIVLVVQRESDTLLQNDNWVQKRNYYTEHLPSTRSREYTGFQAQCPLTCSTCCRHVSGKSCSYIFYICTLDTHDNVSTTCTKWRDWISTNKKSAGLRTQYTL